MATSSVILPTKYSADQPGCDTVAGEGIACSLDCIEQPRFFYGQLLTDQDLTALLAWAQGRLRLGRYRHGWGVACGLEVRCDPQHEGCVIVGPGYAVSDCGDDIVVCADSDPYNLSGACFQEEAACADLRKKATGDTPEVQIRYVDLYIRYAEQGTSPQTALGRRSCGQTEICEYSRTREWYELDHTVSSEYGDDTYQNPPGLIAKQWHEDFNKKWTDLRTLVDATDKWAQLKQRITEQDKQQDRSLHQFCFVYDWIDEALKQKNGSTGRNFYQTLFWVVQDWRNAFLARQCAGVQASLGVPLARVRVSGTTDDTGKQHCNILDIDPFPPYRRFFGPAHWPAPLGHVNLGQLIWRRWADARMILADQGIDATPASGTPLPIPTSKDELTRLFECSGTTTPLFASAADRVTVQIVKVGDYDWRVVGFCPAAGESGGGGASATPEPTAAPTEAPTEAPAEAETPAPAATPPRRRR